MHPPSGIVSPVELIEPFTADRHLKRNPLKRQWAARDQSVIQSRPRALVIIIRATGGLFQMDAIGRTQFDGFQNLLLRVILNIHRFDQSRLGISPEDLRAHFQAGFTPRAFTHIKRGNLFHYAASPSFLAHGPQRDAPSPSRPDIPRESEKAPDCRAVFPFLSDTACIGSSSTPDTRCSQDTSGVFPCLPQEQTALYLSSQILPLGGKDVM